MGFFTKNKQEVTPPQINQQTEERSFFNGALSYNTTSSFVNSQSMRLSAVNGCVNAIAKSISTLPINIYNTDEQGFNNIIYQHPLLKLLNKQPSKNITKYNFFYKIIDSILLKGNGYALIIRDNKGTVTALRYIHPERVTVTYNEIADVITYYVAGYNQPIASENILHFWQYSNDNVNGLSVINYAVNTLKSSSDAENHSANFFRSGAAYSGYLTVQGNPSPQQKQDAKNSWNSAMNGTDGNAVPIIDSGLEFHKISVDAKDSQLIETRNFNLSEVCRFFNVPPQIIFDFNKSSYSTLEQVNLMFLQQCLNPLLFCIEQELNRKLFLGSEADYLSVSFDRRELKNTDKVSTAQYYKDLFVNGILTQNEVRKELNLDNVENGDKFYLQLNMTTTDNIINGTPQQDKLQQKVL